MVLGVGVGYGGLIWVAIRFYVALMCLGVIILNSVNDSFK